MAGQAWPRLAKRTSLELALQIIWPHAGSGVVSIMMPIRIDPDVSIFLQLGIDPRPPSACDSNGQASDGSSPPDDSPPWLWRSQMVPRSCHNAADQCNQAADAEDDTLPALAELSNLGPKDQSTKMEQLMMGILPPLATTTTPKRSTKFEEFFWEPDDTQIATHSEVRKMGRTPPKLAPPLVSKKRAAANKENEASPLCSSPAVTPPIHRG